MKVNNSPAKQRVKRLLQRVRLRYLAHVDVARFSRTASFSVFDSGAEQVVSRIMYNVHALEKGLARGADLRLGFGRKALADLNDALVVHQRLGLGSDDFAYVQGVSVFRRYAELHAAAGAEAALLHELVDPRFLSAESEAAAAAGTKVIRATTKARNRQVGFYDLAQGRSSVRGFSGEPVDTSAVLAAVGNAMKTPSVCNRQGWRVYWVEDPELARQVLRHQRGFGYEQMPEVLLMVTVSNNTFLSPVERNEAFVDGGLFAMSLLYGLEYEGLAAVPLNAMMYAKDQRAVRRLLDVDDSEMIAMFIAVGAFPDESVVPVSDRKPVDSVVKYRGPRRSGPATREAGPGTP